MRIVRVYDASREPRDWMDIIQPGQFAVFASQLDDGAPCDAEGVPTGHDAATCVLVDTLAEAEAFCRTGAERAPSVRFDVFDAAGRSRPPLLTIVHPTREHRLEGHGASRRWHRSTAVTLIVASVLLIALDWRAGWDLAGLMGLPTLLALNALLYAGRLLQLAAAYASNERDRQARVVDRGSPGHTS